MNLALSRYPLIRCIGDIQKISLEVESSKELTPGACSSCNRISLCLMRTRITYLQSTVDFFLLEDIATTSTQSHIRSPHLAPYPHATSLGFLRVSGGLLRARRSLPRCPGASLAEVHQGPADEGKMGLRDDFLVKKIPGGTPPKKMRN